MYYQLLLNQILKIHNFDEAEKVNSDQDTRSLLVIADRLKITIQQVLDMPV